MSKSHTRAAVAMGAAGFVVVALSGAAEASQVGRTTKVVQGVASLYSSPHWSPNVVRIARGSTIKWVAVSRRHFVLAYGGHWVYSHALPQGSSVSRRFMTRGTFLFRCRIHSTMVNGHCQGMCGKVIVH